MDEFVIGSITQSPNVFMGENQKNRSPSEAGDESQDDGSIATADSNSSNEHQFQRGPNQSVCVVCDNHWPILEDVVMKYHVCTLCGMLS
jgi:hypothetical protein